MTLCGHVVTMNVLTVNTVYNKNEALVASPSKITKTRRRLRRKKQGRRRKSYVRNHGTTQPLLNLDEAAFQ